MLASSQRGNKDHTANIAKEETVKLMMLLKEYPVITCKKTDHCSNLQKDAAWKSLCDVFNSDGSRHQSVKQLQQKYKNMIKTARKELTAEKYGRRLTGGGPTPPKPSDTTEWLNSIMEESISGLPAVYDSDALGTPQSMPLMKDRDCEEISKEKIPNNAEVPNVFDSSTPKALLQKPVSKELSVSYNKRKSAFNLLETRKQIMIHTEKKIEFLKQKQLREHDLSNYAKEEHRIHLLHKEEAHQKAMQQMIERHSKYMEQQEELHQIEVQCKKKRLENM
ncbi:uncharacterized protein LOC123689544 isoform X2 [Pieris rapae]|uniref:uncharacterized protein LOC123689544 isoform X2 n=1 Tax=Pieris rapae TaxID=64459 RepID=UPI001E27FF38|nr:uncharacterized protein LOC123689544 isoform X2 [Pieris rapae]